MNRFRTILLALLLPFGLTETPEAAQVVRGPYLQSAGPDRMTVCWRTDVATTSELAWGDTVAVSGVPAIDPGTRTDHAVTLTGLAAATRYYYRVKGTPASGAAVDLGGSSHWFRTAPSPGTDTPLRLWVVGDSGYNYPPAIATYNAYMSQTAQAGKHTDAFVMLGDNAYTFGTDTEYQNAVFNRYGPLLRNTPVWSAIGNHDGQQVPPYTALMPYDSIFRFPSAGESGGVPSGSERYYSFDHGPVHFICLDTNTPGNFDDAPGGGGMVDWLQADLHACTSDWIIAFMHQGPYTKGKSHDSDVEYGMRRTRDHILPLLENYGVDLVLYGHSHVYERSGLIDGHYGQSSTWNAATMRKQPGNGSDLGGVDGAGNFVPGPSLAGGAYRKPAATARSGTVYTVLGAGSFAHEWVGSSTAIVNPTPHPAHQVSLLAVGGMVVEIDGGRLNARYVDYTGAIRDDFTILKGAEYRIAGPDPAFTAPSSPAVGFGVCRDGAIGSAESISFSTVSLTGPAVSPTAGTLAFAAGASEAAATFTAGTPGARFRFELQEAFRTVQAGAAPRRAYRIAAPAAMEASIEATPATTWYASHFGSLPASPAVWETDTDGDGRALLIEYATGGNPSGPDALPAGRTEGGNFVYRYFRAPGRTDLSFGAWLSGDLENWQPAGSLDLSDGPASLQGEPRRVVVPLGPDPRFIRLEAAFAP
jgi:hypothetical protein